MEGQLDNRTFSSVTKDQDSARIRLLGFLPLLFFLVQGIHYWRLHELGNMLWMCNLGNLLLAIGLFTDNRLLVRVSVLWMIPGLVVWFIYVVWAWGVFFSSTLAHLGGFLVGMIALRRVGMDRRTWIYGVLWYFAGQILSRLLTPAHLNVNVAHAVDPGWQATFDSYWKFWLILSLAVAVVLWLLCLILWKAFPTGLRMRESTH